MLYVWVKNGIVIDTTYVPYHYFQDGKNLQDGDQLWVETAYSTGAFPCFTPSSVLEIQNSTPKNSNGEIEIFPNPCKAFATIQINQNDDYKKIELIDIYGRIRYSYSSSSLLNHQKLSFDCSRFEKGVYILRLIGKNGYYTKKVFIEN